MIKGFRNISVFFFIIVTIIIVSFVLIFNYHTKPAPVRTPVLAKTSSVPIAPHPTGNWIAPPEKHYDENNFIARCREKYITEEIKKTGNHQWDLKIEEDAIKRALVKHPGNKGIQYLLAYNQFDRENYDEAIRIFSEILNKNPGEEQAIEGRIYAYFKKEEYETSKDMAEQALETFPHNPRLHHILAGSYLFGFKNPEKAIEIYKKAIKLDPEDVRIWLGYGESYFELKEAKSRKKGIEILTECIKRFPKYHIAYIVLAEEYQYMGDYKKAVELLETSITLDPAYYRAYSIIGDMLISLEKYDEAMEYYRRTVKTNPVYEALIYIKIAKLYRIKNDNKNAEKYLKTALYVHKDNNEQNQEKAMAYLELSRLAVNKNNFKQAQNYIKQAFGCFPHYEYNHYYQALLYLDQKEWQKAKRELNKCKSQKTEESMEEFEILYGKAQIASCAGNLKKSFNYLKKAYDLRHNYGKVEIMAVAKRDRFLKNLRKTREFTELENQTEKIKKLLPPLKLNKKLLFLWKEK